MHTTAVLWSRFFSNIPRTVVFPQLSYMDMFSDNGCAVCGNGIHSMVERRPRISLVSILYVLIPKYGWLRRNDK